MPTRLPALRREAGGMERKGELTITVLALAWHMLETIL